MSFNDGAGVVEALSVTFDGFVALVVAPVVAVEDVLEGGGGDTVAVVGEGDADVAVVRVGAGDGDVDLRAGVFQGVVDEVVEHGGQEIRVAVQPRGGGLVVDVDAELLAVGGPPLFGAGEVLEQFPEVEPFYFQFQPMGIGGLEEHAVDGFEGVLHLLHALLGDGFVWHRDFGEYGLLKVDLVGDGAFQVVDDAVDVEFLVVGFELFPLDGLVEDDDAEGDDGEKADDEQDTVAGLLPEEGERVGAIGVQVVFGEKAELDVAFWRSQNMPRNATDRVCVYYIMDAVEQKQLYGSGMNVGTLQVLK